MVLPPPRLSTTTCCPQLSVSFWPSRRAMIVVLPPGTKGTIQRIGFVGYVAWAHTTIGHARSTSSKTLPSLIDAARIDARQRKPAARRCGKTTSRNAANLRLGRARRSRTASGRGCARRASSSRRCVPRSPAASRRGRARRTPLRRLRPARKTWPRSPPPSLPRGRDRDRSSAPHPGPPASASGCRRARAAPPRGEAPSARRSAAPACALRPSSPPCLCAPPRRLRGPQGAGRNASAPRSTWSSARSTRGRLNPMRSSTPSAISPASSIAFGPEAAISTGMRRPDA